MSEEVEVLLNTCLEAMRKARMTQYKDTADLVDAEVAIEDYFTMNENLFIGYDNLFNSEAFSVE